MYSFVFAMMMLLLGVPHVAFKAEGRPRRRLILRCIGTVGWVARRFLGCGDVFYAVLRCQPWRGRAMHEPGRFDDVLSLSRYLSAAAEPESERARVPDEATFPSLEFA